MVILNNIYSAILCKEVVQNKDILVKSNKSTKYILLMSKSFIYLLLASYHSCFAKLRDHWTQSIRIAGRLALSLTDGMSARRAVKGRGFSENGRDANESMNE